MVGGVRHVRAAGVLSLMAGFRVLPAAQEGMQREGRGGPPARVVPTRRVPGQRDGVSIFPKVDYAQLKPLKPGEIDFKHYHSYEEAIALLEMWVARYPDLVGLYSVGPSFEGRDIWQPSITNKTSGKDMGTPAFVLEGGRHAAEISGIETTLYFINHELSNYGSDPAITKLVDTRTLYVRPDACTIRLGSGQELVKTADGKSQPATIEIGWMKAGEAKTVTCQVKGAGTATVSVASTRGGIDRRDAEVK